MHIDSKPQQRMKQFIVCCITGLLLMSSIGSSSAKPRAAPAPEYAGINRSELISAFKQAYLDAGYQLIEERKEEGFRVLEFELPIPLKKSLQKFAIKSSVFISWEGQGRGKVCAPCSVNEDTVPGQLLGWPDEDAQYVEKVLSVVHTKIDTSIRSKLSKYLKPEPPYTPCIKRKGVGGRIDVIC